MNLTCFCKHIVIFLHSNTTIIPQIIIPQILECFKTLNQVKTHSSAKGEVILGAEEITEGIFSVSWSQNYRKCSNFREMAVNNWQDIGYLQFYHCKNSTPLTTAERVGVLTFSQAWKIPLLNDFTRTGSAVLQPYPAGSRRCRTTAESCAVVSPSLQNQASGCQMCSGCNEEVQGNSVSPHSRMWATDLGLYGPGTEITVVALTLIPDTELTSKSRSGWGRAGSANYY